jgi:hypothetical protein
MPTIMCHWPATNQRAKRERKSGKVPPLKEYGIPPGTQDNDPYLTLERLLPAVKEEAQLRGTRDPIWDLINRAEALLSRSKTEDWVAASTIADWMTVRFG